MSKKRIYALSLLTMMICLVGCGKKISKDEITADVISNPTTEITNDMTNASDVLPTTEEILSESEIAGSSDTISVEEINSIDEEGIRKLVDANLTFNYYLINPFSMLENPDWNPDENGYIIPVKESIFPDYESFETFVRGIYVKEYAERFFSNYPYEGISLFVNMNGKLNLDMMAAGGKGYFVDWKDYKIRLGTISPKRVEFVAVTSIIEPGETVDPQPYEIKGVAVYEDGKWLLERAVF